ncbi:MAG TPA: CDP-alcohol phosphatidyltransferase family protein [Acidimicrobiia bacterium]|nr:CDP-alcohol phosphatidyltransferase family protein [Acidimicrobiia bacterium]
MSEEPVSNKILTIPNVVSFIRLAAIPVFWWLLLGADDVTGATILFALVATTDWVDGYLARRLGQVTKLGKALDPVADRLMIASAVVAGLIAGIVPVVIAVTLIVRELYMAVLTFGLVARKGGTLEVRWLGKLATFLVYSSIAWFYMAAIPFLEVLTLPMAWVGSIVGLALYWVTAFQYTRDAIEIMSKLESTASPEESR